MQKRKLGNSNLEVSAIGLGLHGHELFLRAAQRQTGDDRSAAGGRGTRASPSSTPPKSTARSSNEELVGEALAPFRGQVVIATKFGFDLDPQF